MIVPFAYAKVGNTRPETLGGELGLPDASNTFLVNVFVVLTTGALVAVASGGALTCGLVLDASKPDTTINPPTSFFGDRHWPLSPRGQRFAVSVTDATGHVGEANGAPQLSEIVIGTSYNILKLSNGNHALNVDSSSAPFFTVVEIPTRWNSVAQTSTTYNPVVIVEIVAAAQQAV